MAREEKEAEERRKTRLFKGRWVINERWVIENFKKMQITKLSKRRFVKDDLIGERAEYLTHYSDRGTVVSQRLTHFCIIVSIKWWNKFQILEKKPEWKNGVILLREDRFAFDRFTKLPPEIMRKIIDFVHYDDVINFRKAYRESCVCQTFLSELRISKRKRDKKMIQCQFRNCTVKYWSKASLRVVSF